MIETYSWIKYKMFEIILDYMRDDQNIEVHPWIRQNVEIILDYMRDDQNIETHPWIRQNVENS